MAVKDSNQVDLGPAAVRRKGDNFVLFAMLHLKNDLTVAVMLREAGDFAAQSLLVKFLNLAQQVGRFEFGRSDAKVCLVRQIKVKRNGAVVIRIRLPRSSWVNRKPEIQVAGGPCLTNLHAPNG